VFGVGVLGAEGAEALAGASTGNNTITELILRGNNLGDEGVEALATALMVRRRA
jgi:hypothetical protein